jgi:hypothetical protein
MLAGCCKGGLRAVLSPGMSEGGSGVDASMLAVSALVPGGLAAALAGNVADAAHGEGVARVLGLDPQAWRALDPLVGAVVSLVPLGTHALRAALGGALVASASGAILYVVFRELLAACADTVRLRSVVAAVATLSVLVTFPWQMESATVGGSALGAALTLLPIAVIAGRRVNGGQTPWLAATFSLGLAAGYEPLVGACAVSASAVLVFVAAPLRRSIHLEWRASKVTLSAVFLAGMAPWIVALVCAHRSGLPLLQVLANDRSGERGVSVSGSPFPFIRAEVGGLTILLSFVGGALATLVPRARPVAFALMLVVVFGFACGKLGSPLGPTRYGAPVLAAFAAANGLAGVGLQAIVRRIVGARVPFARASASMVLLLALARPVDAADDSLLRSRSGDATAAWDDVAWGGLAPRTVVLLTDPRLYARARAAHARGALRDDLVVVPAYTHGPLARRVLASDASLVPLWRDLEIVGSPGEGSLSLLSAARPVAMAYEPRWGRVLSRHLIPAALLDRFEFEPRGASDRRYALDAFVPNRDRLARVLARDPELKFDTAYLLRARAIVVAASGDRDLVGRAVDDVRIFAPADHVASEILARENLAKGSARFDDLRP